MLYFGQEPYIDPDVDYVAKRFQYAGFAKCEAFMLQEIKLVPFTNHSSILKFFAAQLKSIPSLFFSYWNENTLFGHLETIKTEGIDGFEDVGRKMASLGLHPNATDSRSKGDSLCWGLFSIFVKLFRVGVCFFFA